MMLVLDFKSLGLFHVLTILIILGDVIVILAILFIRYLGSLINDTFVLIICIRLLTARGGELGCLLGDFDSSATGTTGLGHLILIGSNGTLGVGGRRLAELTRAREGSTNWKIEFSLEFSDTIGDRAGVLKATGLCNCLCINLR
jgi:hypothetical protein